MNVLEKGNLKAIFTDILSVFLLYIIFTPEIGMRILQVKI
jgi:hypothetical protein